MRYCTQIWREKVLPRLMDHLAEEVDSVTSYYIVYHEATVANLLEVLESDGIQPLNTYDCL